MKTETQQMTRHAILDLTGATCTSCSIAIEHLGKKLNGISEIFVDRATSTIQVAYDGDQEVLTKLCDFVARIGYEATVRTTD